MAVLGLKELSFSYGGKPLIENATVQVELGERVCLVGRNGTGKSTLMKLMLGELKPDTGLVEVQSGIKLARQIQDVPRGVVGTVFDEVARGLGPHGEAVAAQYWLHQLSQSQLSQNTGANPRTADEIRRMEELSATLDPAYAWEWEHQVEQIIERMELPHDRPFDNLSSGMKRRVLLAKSLVIEPDVLLLDEPTNHLDIEAIRWLEEFLLRFSGTLIFVTHDRMFLQRLATRIIEIDRARLFDWTCDYQTFLQRKEAALAAEEHEQALFDKKLAQEEVWIRKGVKARNVRNQGRVKALMEMRKERAARRAKVGNVKVELHQEAERSGTVVALAEKVNYEVGGRTILRDVSTLITRGDKIGILGPNGCGKTTLLRILLGELTPQSGKVKLGTRLEIAYFDQLRAQLNDDLSVQENVSPGADMIEINGRRRHVIGYLEDFLFSPERSRTLVKYLSGGERNRLLLARLFSKPSNLLVLDEPTNDLDAETLELLEDLLVEYPGTVLLVSHDRQFINNVVTQTLVFEGEGSVNEYVGGYDDWLAQKSVRQNTPVVAQAVSVANQPAAKKGKSLSFKEDKELAELPARIESLEFEQASLETRMGQPEFFKQSPQDMATVTERLNRLHQELETAYARWEELEVRRNG
ncbi:ribosomal protection-like ABC-F family protein [Planctopirus ephydatiae]|nr:ATP-binding cassette domain-containing protein [Planctopirus ephydatiae]